MCLLVTSPGNQDVHQKRTDSAMELASCKKKNRSITLASVLSHWTVSGGEEVGSIGGIQLQPLRTLPSGAACAEETPAPVSACTVTAGDAPAAAEQECQLSLAQIHDVPRLRDAYDSATSAGKTLPRIRQVINTRFSSHVAISFPALSPKFCNLGFIFSDSLVALTSPSEPFIKHFFGGNCHIDLWTGICRVSY